MNSNRYSDNYSDTPIHGPLVQQTDVPKSRATTGIFASDPRDSNPEPTD